MNGVIRWEDPPRRGDTRAEPWDSQSIAAELRARPGQWALVRLGVGTNGTAWHIENASQMTAFRPAGAFEACTRSTPDGVATYARYIGEPSPEVQR